MAKIEKARFWVGVLYQENMRSNWQEEIGDIVQLPYAYCCHTQDKDSKSEHRKDHLHLILSFPNTTTYKHAMSVFNQLSADGKTALNKIEAVINIRNMYDYLIHDTETCRKQKKELYDKKDRITGNNFDIGAYEQLGAAEKDEMCRELCNDIISNGFTNFTDFYVFVISNYENSNYFEIVKTYSGLFEKLTRGNYQKCEQFGCSGCSATEKQPKNCCPFCGSFDIKKNGKTAQNQQKWQCKDCEKSFI